MYSQITANKRKTFIMIALFLVLIVCMAWILTVFLGAQPYITYYVALGALMYVFVSYFTSSRAMLAINGAQQISKKDNPRLYRIVENLSITEGLPMPKVYIIDDTAPNAFAIGRNPNSSSVAVTSGLLEIMDNKELEGVLAHEMGHIKNYDIRVSMVAFALVAVIGLMSDIILRLSWFSDNDDNNGSYLFIIGIIGAILAPIIAGLIQLAISRKREYLADATGALTTRYPEGLASALKKIDSYGSVMKRQSTSTAHLFFANPLKKGNLSNLFSTHPPIKERIKRLTKMEDNL